ncbi:MAG TPA: hypothetical protein DFJ59_03905 [Alphaproteobacteria bacterium]|nr:hypothetical protein [Alphaproteobacteria bacterium]
MRRLMRFWRKNGDQSPRDPAHNVDYHDLEPGFGTGAKPMQAAADASAETAVDADWATEDPAVETEFTDARSSDAERAGAGLAEEDFAGSMADRAAAMPPPAPKPERSTRTALEQRRQRLSRVSRARRIGTVLSVAVPLTLLTLFIGGGGWAWYSGRLDIASIRGTEAAQVAGATLGLRIEEFSISGRRYTRESEIVAAVGAYYGDPILGIEPGDAKLRIEGLPWVQSAEVERILPKTISVTVVERVPLAIWQNDARHQIIDTEGMVIPDQQASLFLEELPVVSGLGAPEAASTLIDALTEVPNVQQYVVAAHRRGTRRWDLFLTLGIKVQLPAQDTELALRQLSEADLKYGLFDRDIVNIDLRIPNRMIVRKRNDSEGFDLDLFSDDENVSTYFQDNTENSLTPVSDSITL